MGCDAILYSPKEFESRLHDRYIAYDVNLVPQINITKISRGCMVVGFKLEIRYLNRVYHVFKKSWLQFLDISRIPHAKSTCTKDGSEYVLFKQRYMHVLFDSPIYQEEVLKRDGKETDDCWELRYFFRAEFQDWINGVKLITLV